MTAQTAYRSTDGDVLAAWDAFANEMARHHLAVSTFKKRFPNHQLMTYSRPSSFAGLRGKDSPGPCWRYVKKDAMWVPRRQGAGGKALAAECDALRGPRLRLPGMPDIIMGIPRFFQPGVALMGGAVWVTWGCEAEEVERQEPTFKAALWERAKLSEYHAAREAQEVAA